MMGRSPSSCPCRPHAHPPDLFRSFAAIMKRSKFVFLVATIWLAQVAGLPQIYDSRQVIPPEPYTGKGSFGHPGILGDVDGDGTIELVVGQYSQALDDSGVIHFIFLKPGGEYRVYSLTQDQLLPGQYQPQRGVFWGFSVTGVGDVDGNGYPDFAVSCVYCLSPRGTGRLWIFFLQKPVDANNPINIDHSKTREISGFTLQLQTQGFGYHVAPGGDINGDGKRAQGWFTGRLAPCPPRHCAHSHIQPHNTHTRQTE